MNLPKYLKFGVLFTHLICSVIFCQKLNPSKLETARRAVIKKDYKTAEKLYKELILTDKNNWLYYAGLNSVYIKTQNYDKSIELLNQRKIDKPLDVSAICELGTTYYILKDINKAFELWDEAFKKSGSNQTLISMVSNYPIRYRCYDKAIEYLSKGKTKVSNPISFLHQLGNIYITTSDFINATEVYCELVNIDSKQLPVANNAIRRMFLRNKIIPEVETIIENSYNNTSKVEYLELLKTYYLLGNKLDKAKETLLKLYEKNKNLLEVFNLADQLFKVKEYESASELYQIIVDNDSGTSLKLNSKIKLLDISKHKLVKSDKEKHAYIEALLDISKKYEALLKGLKFKNLEPEILYKMAEIKNEVEGNFSGFLNLSNKYSESKFGVLANFKLVEYCTSEKKLDTAVVYIYKILNSRTTSNEQKNEAKFLLIKNLFWKNEFAQSRKKIDELFREPKSKNTNEAIELSLLISVGKNDSVSLSKYAKADFFSAIKDYESAVKLLLELSVNENLLVINFYSAIKLAEIGIKNRNYNESLEILVNLIKKEKISPFYDKALYLQGKIFQFGLGDYPKAIEIYSEMINKYPDSIYIDECRNNIMLMNKN